MLLELITELPPSLIGLAISGIVLVVSYIVYKIGIREKSFEQVIEDQKRRSIEEEQKQKSEKVKKEKKFKKTWGKKTKEKVETEMSTESVQVIEPKDAALEIEIIAPKEIKPIKNKNKSKLPDVATQEKNKKSENSQIVEKLAQEKKKTSPEIERVKPEPKVEKAKIEPKVEIKIEQKVENVKIEPKVETLSSDEFKESQTPLVTSVQTAPKKKKKEPVEKDVAPITTSKILSFIKESELESEEIQNLIDILLNKQKDSSGWTKKNDNLAITKKNLQEKEQLLEQEHRQNQAVTSKLKDLREEYNSLKAKMTNLEKSSQEKIIRLQQENQTLTAKVKQVQEQLAAEKEKSSVLEKDSASLKILEEEKVKLLQKIAKLEAESRSGISKTEYDTLKKSKEDLQKVHALLVEQHTQFVLKEKSLTTQLSDAKSEVEKLKSLNKALTEDCETVKKSLATVESAKRSIEEKFKLQEMNSASIKTLEEEKANLLQKISKLEAESQSGISKVEYDTLKKSKDDLQKVYDQLVEQYTQLGLKEKSLATELSDAKSQISKLSSLNKILTEDYKAAKESLASVESVKRSIEEKFKVEEKHCAELEMQVKQLSAQTATIAQLKAELNELRSENERLANQLVTTKERVAGDGQEVLHQNGELNRKPEEISEKILDKKDELLQEKEYIVVQLNEELSKQKAKITLLKEEIEVQKQKNNELREKNWKAMEALEKAEKTADQRIKEIQTTADKKVTELEKELSAAKISSQSDSETSEKLKKAASELAQKQSDYNRELEKNKQLSSEIDKIKESYNLRIAEIQENVEELKLNLSQCQTKTKECLQRICPAVSIDSSLPFEKWLLQFEQQVLETMKFTQSTESVSNLEEILNQKGKEYLEKQAHYERVLSETESTLLELQKNAESQEVLWQERLNVKEQELEQVKLERDSIIAEKEAMQSTFQNMGQLKELQEELKLLQHTVANNEKEFEQRYDEVQKNCLNLRDQLENKEKEIAELKKKSSSLDSLTKEIEDLKSKLDKELKINKDFSSQMVRLHSLVKIGQDALTAEQEMVKQLKAQLEAAQVSTANGTASATKTSPVTVNESQPKTKSAEKSKKRMDASDKK